MKNAGVFVITGGSQGLGKVLAAEVLKAGYPVALIARTASKLKSAAQELKATFGEAAKVTMHAADLTKDAEVKKAFAEIRKTHGPIRALINNAGTWMGSKTIDGISRQEVQKSLDLNFFSAFNATKAALESFHKGKGAELAIINIGATASLQGWGSVASFCIAKGALRHFSQSLAREMGPKGIHVAHLVIDGIIDNERTRGLNAKTPKNRFIQQTSLAKTIIHVALQEKSCWTFEWDVRPYHENW